MSNKKFPPKVSIVCLTFNQVKYIRESLDSFLNQQTDFNFEILVNDDASTDGTQKILREYVDKYPEKVFVNFQNKNLYSQGLRNFIPRFLISKARGKYIAVCEGDDYWTDRRKLQKQVDFMESHPSYSVCFHAVEVKYEADFKPSFIFPDVKDSRWYTLHELLKTNYIPTCSVMYRKSSNYDNYPLNIAPGDWFMHLYHAKQGKIKYMKDAMSVYRKHKGGVWWDYDVDRSKIWVKHGIEHMEMQKAVQNLYKDNPEFTKTITDNIDRLISDFAKVPGQEGATLVAELVRRYPDDVIRYILSVQEKLESQLADIDLKNKELQNVTSRIDELWSAIREQDKIIADKQKIIDHLEASIINRIYKKIKKK